MTTHDIPAIGIGLAVASVLQAEGLAELGFLLVGQVGADKLGVGPAELDRDLVVDGSGTEHEQRRRAGRDFLPDVADERVADPHIAHRAEQRAAGGADSESAGTPGHMRAGRGLPGSGQRCPALHRQLAPLTARSIPSETSDVNNELHNLRN